MTDRDEIKQRVKDATDLAEWIRRDGVPLTGGPTEFKALCPFHKEKHPSFTVFHKDGQWNFHCFGGCDASGDIFEWVMRRKGLSFPEALKLVANAANIALPSSGERIYQPGEVKAATVAEPPREPFDPEKFRALTSGSAAYRYLTEKRMLSIELLTDYSVGETVDGLAYSFAYKWRPPTWPAKYEKPKFEFCKVVKVERPDGKKVEWRAPKGGKNILFGMESTLVKKAHAEGGELVICEGEIDAVTWGHYGFAGVSVPSGAGSLQWMDVCFEWLQPFKRIHVSFDEDGPGHAKLSEIVKRLGIARADKVRLPERTAA